MKRISLLLVLLMLCALCALCASALAEDGFTLKDGALNSIPEGMLDVAVPAEVDGEPVLSISSFAMGNNRDITGITVPEGVLMLDGSAIYGNDSLTFLTLPDTLQVIGDYNVFACDILEEVTIPAAVQYIGAHSFYSNDMLRSVTFLGRPPVIAEDSFMFGADDFTVYVPDDCYEDYCRILPEDLTVLPSGRSTEAVDTIIPEDDLDFDAASGTITGYHGAAFAGELPAVIGGVPVTTIGENALASLACPLRFVRLPEGVTAIADGAFNHSRLFGIAFPASLKTIGASAFEWATECVPYWAENNGVEVIGAHAFDTTDVPRSFHIPYGVREIGEKAFYNIRFGEVYFPETVQTVGDAAFGKSPYLTYLCFAGADLPLFGTDVFDCQEQLEDVDIAWNASRAQYDAARAVFADMGMTVCTVWRNNPAAAGVATTARGDYADGFLVSCGEELADVTVYSSFDDVKIIGVGDSCFENDQTIRSFYPHHCDWFTTIGARAFYTSSLEQIELFDSITTIGEYAFTGSRLRTVEIPWSVTSIGSGVFAYCGELTMVILLCDPELVPDNAFIGCSQVTVFVPDTMSPKACKALSARLGVPVTRPSGLPEAIVCPYPATDPADFWIDDSFNRLDHYEGYELNLVLPQERDGVALTMLSGNTLTRARSEDGSPVQLPVRSVVVPEKYEEVVYNAFNDLPDLEVAVIYAPLSTAFNSMFSNCPRLRAVVFVNGVDTVAGYAFRNCPALETVYVGSDAVIDPNAFYDCGAMTPASVTAVLPDVDALLAAVKSEPLARPEPEATPELPDAVPVTDPNAVTYLGAWSLQSMVMGDESIDPADFGFSMTLLLTDDGLAAMVEDGEYAYTVWRMENGAAFILADGVSFSPIELNSDGSITLSQEGISMVFIRGDAAPAEVQLPADAMAFVGTWVTDDGSTSIQVNADGTVMMFVGGDSQQTTWGVEGGMAFFVLGPGSSVPMILTDSGLELRADNMTLVFRSAGEASAPVQAQTPADPAAFVGHWTCIWMHTGPVACDPVAAYGGNWDFIINADGTGVLYPGGETHAALEVDESGFTRFNGMVILIREDGRLQYGSEMSGGMIFSQIPGDQWDPMTDAFAIPGEAMTTPVPEQPFVQPQQPAAAQAPDTLAGRVDMKFVAATVTTGGITMDASMMGGEYAITFSSTGSALFTMAGTEIPGLFWTADDAAFHVTYFDGTDLAFIATPEGFDMDFYGAMVYHFIPAQ